MFTRSISFQRIKQFKISNALQYRHEHRDCLWLIVFLSMWCNDWPARDIIQLQIYQARLKFHEGSLLHPCSIPSCCSCSNRNTNSYNSAERHMIYISNLKNSSLKKKKAKNGQPSSYRIYNRRKPSSKRITIPVHYHQQSTPIASYFHASCISESAVNLSLSTYCAIL
jgi:hypothetical protein